VNTDSFVDALQLIDHHCHGVVSAALDRDGFESLLSEGGAPPAGLSNFDTPLALAVRRWCAPALDLPAHADADAYLRRRIELGTEEVNRRLLRGTGTSHYLMDTGFRSADVLTPGPFGAAAGAETREVVRLEAIAEQVAGSGTDAASFLPALDAALDDATASAVGTKSIIAYRGGFDFEPEPPAEHEVTRAASEWLRGSERNGGWRLDHPVLQRHLLWWAVRRELPLQFHVGYGDPDIVLFRTDPSRMTAFLKATASSGTPMMLLHCYPFQRHAAYLAAVLPHVYFDIGLTIPYVGASAAKLLGEALEVAPFTKLLYSSDAFGLPELYLTGAILFRRALSRVLGEWLADDAITTQDAERVASLICADNARRVYRL
jgi:predicted TIM-barrel fold metal-dependent hydrolase